MSSRVLRRVAGALVVIAGVVSVFPGVASAQVNVSPSTEGMPGAELWGRVLGWVMQWGLWLSLAAIVLGAGGWWISASTGQYNGAARGKQFVLGGAIGALVIGLGPTMVNLLFNAGRAG